MQTWWCQAALHGGKFPAFRRQAADGQTPASPQGRPRSINSNYQLTKYCPSLPCGEDLSSCNVKSKCKVAWMAFVIQQPQAAATERSCRILQPVKSGLLRALLKSTIRGNVKGHTHKHTLGAHRVASSGPQCSEVNTANRTILTSGGAADTNNPAF